MIFVLAKIFALQIYQYFLCKFWMLDTYAFYDNVIH